MSAYSSSRQGLDVPSAFAVASRRSDDLAIIALTGELDAANIELLDQTIREAEEGDSETIFLDLRELSFIDSMGLSVLLEARRRSDRIRFVPSEHDQVARLIALTGTAEVLGYPLTGEPADREGTNAGAIHSHRPGIA